MAEQVLTSQRALAKAVGASASTVAGWLKREDCPVRRRGPWSTGDVERLQAWRREFQEDRSGKAREPGPAAAPVDSSPSAGEASPASSRQKVEIALKYQRMRKAKVEADEAEGRVVARSILDSALAGLTVMFVTVLQDMFEALPHKLDGDPTTNQRILEDAGADACRRVLDHQAIELAQAEEKLAAVREGKAAARGRKGASR